MNIRKDSLVNGQVYHVFNRSIAKYTIFNGRGDYMRFIEMLSLYRHQNFPYCYSRFKILSNDFQNQFLLGVEKENKHLVEIIAFCVMPTHFQFVLRQVSNDGISKFMAKVLNSYAKYFNAEHARSGPLFEGHFKSVLIKDDIQLLHITRYVHLNPVSAGIINSPEEWEYSSYVNYLNPERPGIITPILDLKPEKYQKFVNDQISCQRELSKIKALLIDNYSG